MPKENGEDIAMTATEKTKTKTLDDYLKQGWEIYHRYNPDDPDYLLNEFDQGFNEGMRILTQYLQGNRPALNAGMNKPIKVSIYSSKGRSTGKHNFSIEGIFPMHHNSVEEAKEEAIKQFKELGHTVEFVKED